ncbi:MAG: Asp-tRNA(Asn)/Glu-tRNA(Gln) amidotransferase subunit GatB [Candidatus Moraniibacteriota bacterium]|nr:MAG: Asp-tRNA(Asn)/Glu-tRNA(Gln) amidotransferase subunit GatB [Candidatus Moranbacteria bacterium]
MSNYTPVIGLEIHVQLATKSKMFSRCSADWFGKEPNTVVCPVSLGLPGALPVPNKKAIEWAILIGMALNCKQNKVSKFDRKHYFYPDLPKGYQISQYDQPFSYDGFYEFMSKASGKLKKVRIKRVHLEEDTGKLIHDGEQTLVDFNRAGMPLVEIVTEPDFDNSDDVKQFLEELQTIIRSQKVSEADMEKGSMRLEPNISLRKEGETELPSYKVEVKNINSFNFAKKAIDFELKRHAELLDNGETPAQETRGYNEGKGVTVSQRIKEEAADYRYFPEPDIPPFEFDEAFFKAIRSQMRELPHEKVKRYVDQGVGADEAYIISRDRTESEKFDKLIALLDKELIDKAAKLVVNKKVKLNESAQETAKQVREMLAPKETNESQLALVVDKVIANNTDQVAAYKNGKETVLMFFVGQVMKEMKGQADAQRVQQVLREKLSS